MTGPWLQFSEKQSTSLFVQSAYHLYGGSLERLSPGEIPFFFDHWLTRLNLCDVWLRFEGDEPVAMISKPKIKDIHFERWQYNTLVIADLFQGEIQIPFEIKKAAAFLTPAKDYDINFRREYNSSYFQKGYARSTENLPQVTAVEGVKFSAVTAAQLPDVLSLLDQGYHWEGQAADYIPNVKAEITRAVKMNAGWCYIASREDAPIAVVSFLALPNPMFGVTGVVVGDLFVKTEERGKKIASSLQMFAYHELQKDGVRWITGNIDPTNEASTRQALRVGRTPLYNTLVLEKKAWI